MSKIQDKPEVIKAILTTIATMNNVGALMIQTVFGDFTVTISIPNDYVKVVTNDCVESYELYSSNELELILERTSEQF